MCSDQKGKNSVVLIGASYVEGWSIESISGYRVINVGIDGNQSFEMKARFTKDVLDRKPQAVIIWGFINDIFRSSPEGFDKTFARIKQSYREMVGEAERDDLNIFLVTEVTIREPDGFMNWLAGVAGRIRGKESYQSQVNSRVLEINSWLKAFAYEKDIPVLDFEQVLSDSDGRRKALYATSDGSHLTAAAYAALSAYVADRIELSC